MSTHVSRVARAMALVLAAAAAFGSAGCDRGTYLEVRLRDPAPKLTEVYAVRMALTLTPPSGGAPLHANDVIRNEGKVIKFPTSMAFSLDEYEGLLRLDATALGVGDLPVGQGSATTTIMRDKTWAVNIDLGAL